MVNCSVETPYAEDFMRGLRPVTLGFFVFLSLVTLSTCGLFVELWVFLSRNVSSTLVKDRCLIVLGLFPVISIAAQLGMTVPRAATLVDLITSVYTGTSLFAFFHLTVAYLGGEEPMLQQMQRVDSVLSVDAHSPVFYLGIVMGVSTLLSLYVFNILMRTGLQIADHRYRLLPKYSIVMVTVLINSLQPLLIEVLTAYSVVPCTAEFHWNGRASEFNHMLKVFEAFILMLSSRRLYRKPYPLSETESLSFSNLHYIR
ncbi:organic solute transporter subunit alpha-like [Centroberyx gerrardi]|uniref:organic solute transporter subunit alpha-like n=1 Tax=Centroberyx gerrardi TaxID=166262 RepID=UPI003AB0ADAF